MGDPQVAEYILMVALNENLSRDNADLLGAAANLALVDCFDRRILREQFLDIVGNAASVQSYLTRVRTVRLIRAMLDEGILTKEKLDEAEIKLVAFGEAARKALIRQMELVVQCPTSEDKVN